MFQPYWGLKLSKALTILLFKSLIKVLMRELCLNLALSAYRVYIYIYIYAEAFKQSVVEDL